jgi:VanZ family protein
LNKGFLIAAIIIVAVILYGSLYPFTFRRPADGIGAMAKLLQSWADPPRRGDFVSNILFYMPLGFFGALVVAGRGRALQAIAFATIAGTLLSISMELAQYYVRGRVTAADDVYANVTGAALGAIVGSVAYGNFRWPPLRDISSNRVPCLLLALWLGYRLFPYVPTIDLHKYWEALKPVVLYPSLTGYDFLRYSATWLALGALIEAIAGPKRTWLLFPLFVGSVVAAKVVIVGKTLNMAEFAGAGLALAAWSVLAAGAGPRFRVTSIALLFSVAVIAERLAPFQFTQQARQFGWVPFLSFMYGSLAVNIVSFFEKTFLYGTLIWLLGRTELGFGRSTVLVTIMLLTTSWVETHLPNRSAEITDALMAVLIGAIISLMETEKASPVRETP